MTERIFITGLGAVSPAGLGVGRLWSDLLTGSQRFVPLDKLYAGMRSGTLGGRVPSDVKQKVLELSQFGTGQKKRVASAYSEHAALEALRDAGIAASDPMLDDALVCVGSSDGQADVVERAVASDVQANSFGGFSSYSIAEDVANRVGARGLAFTAQSTCASANVALSSALEMLREGVSEVAIVGGCDIYSEKNIIGFSSLQAIGTSPCKPFSADRRYVTPAEGAGFLILQTERSLRPEQRVYAELLAVAVSNDASHPTAPDLEGVASCHKRALIEAGIVASDVDVIYAHGTGSRINDAIEGSIFVEQYPSASVTAIKGTIGHLMGAAGAIGAIAACLTLSEGLVPPTVIGDGEIDPAVNLVRGNPLPVPHVRYVQNNAFGFGGNNAIAIFGSAND